MDDAWIDISCFQRAPAGQFGDSGVGILRGPGYWNWDLGLSKNFYFADRRYVTFRVEAFNVLNHPNYALRAGSADIADPTTFGRIQNTFSAPRIVELVLKFTFLEPRSSEAASVGSSDEDRGIGRHLLA